MKEDSNTESKKEARIPWIDLVRVSPRTNILQRADKIWWYVLISLPIDLLIIGETPHISFAEEIFGILVFASFVSLWRRKLFIAGLAATKWRRRLFSKTGKWTPLFLLGVMSIFLLAESLTKGDSEAFIGTIVSLIIGVGGLLPAYKSIKEKLLTDTQRNKNRLVALKFLEDQALGLCIASFIPARLISTIGIFAVADYPYIPTLLSLILLILLRPQREDFEIYCPRCFSRTSIAFSGVPYCHACSRKAFREKPHYINELKSDREQRAIEIKEQ